MMLIPKQKTIIKAVSNNQRKSTRPVWPAPGSADTELGVLMEPGTRWRSRAATGFPDDPQRNAAEV
jgi:hypothetical protein